MFLYINIRLDEKNTKKFKKICNFNKFFISLHWKLNEKIDWYGRV